MCQIWEGLWSALLEAQEFGEIAQISSLVLIIAVGVVEIASVLDCHSVSFVWLIGFISGLQDGLGDTHDDDNGDEV